jgi:hypothetical protein
MVRDCGLIGGEVGGMLKTEEAMSESLEVMEGAAMIGRRG